MIGTRAMLALSAAVLVAGCFGGGGGGGQRMVANPSTYGEYVTNNILLRRELEQLPRFDMAELPTTGSATYVGTSGFNNRMNTSEQTRLFGRIELTTGFSGTGTVTGRIDNIVSDGNIYSRENAGRVTGALTISNGTFDRNPIDPRFNPHFTADISGTLSEPHRTEVYTGRLDGQFFGTNRDMVSGGINGLSNRPGFGQDRFTGSFNAQLR